MRRVLGIAAAGVGLVVLILWSGGFLVTGKIPPGKVLVPRPTLSEEGATVQAELTEVTDCHEAVGTVRPRTETRIEAQITAKVLDVRVHPGDRVKAGDTLIVMDGREVSSRLEQARRGLENAAAVREQVRRSIDAAKAGFDRAEAHYRRIKTLYQEKAVASSELDQAEASYLQAEAALRQARDGLTGAEAGVGQAQKLVEQNEIALEYTTIKAIEDAEVAKRQVEPGDLAFPGKALLYVQAGGALRLEALVPETLINRVRPGGEFSVLIAAYPGTMQGIVEEVVPTADPRTRTFLVKAGLPPSPGVYPGMFGRLFVPLARRNAVLVPAKAIRRVGQLETVAVRAPGDESTWQTVYVRSGPAHGDKVEILAGLAGGESVAVPSEPGAGG